MILSFWMYERFWKVDRAVTKKTKTFYSSLTGKESDKEYEHGLKVWNKFEIKTMKDYHDLYLKCDVLLLADVFKKFRNNTDSLFQPTSFKLGCNA